MSTELTAVSTHGWFASPDFTHDLLRSVGTFGWYGVTVGDLVDFFKTVDFTLIVKRLEELGLEIHQIEDIDPVEIMTQLDASLTITPSKNFNLVR